MPVGRPGKSLGESAPKKSVSKTAKSAKNVEKGTPKRKYPVLTGEPVFALDIGTRTVVGVIGCNENDKFKVIDYAIEEHTKRAMIDGQIEDIDEVAKVVRRVKKKLEDDLNLKLNKVNIAAAGRALKTQRVSVDIDIEGRDSITDEAVRAFEIEAIQKAQEDIDSTQKDTTDAFYCVGHSVVNYYLDDYPIKSFVGHKGKKATVDMLAAFLPSTVVESLYAVMDKNALEVESLTLEPIAAMNVVIPAEVRLINIALVDIGAGTSDIAISKNGSIVAYAMATTAGDEITEAIIKHLLVDFKTAESIKQNCSGEYIKYKDILGFEHNMTSDDFFAALSPAVDGLAKIISEEITKANGGESPAAVFLVGGGSRIPSLAQLVAEKLNLPENRVAVGSKSTIKGVTFGYAGKYGPEFVTPLGIGATALTKQGYDFSTVSLNDKKVRIFNTRKVTVLDLLSMAGYKSSLLIGRTGRNLTYTVNGIRKLIKGTPAVPAVITLNGGLAGISSEISAGDDIKIIPAKNGGDAVQKISDICDPKFGFVTVNGEAYPFGTAVSVNTKSVSGDYEIQNFDEIRLESINTLKELKLSLPFGTANTEFFIRDKKIGDDYRLSDNDEITAKESERRAAEVVSAPVEVSATEEAADETIEPIAVSSAANAAENIAQKYAKPEKEPEKPEVFVEPQVVSIVLNGHSVKVIGRTDGSQPLFFDAMPLAGIDTRNPQGDDIEVLLNGQEVSYTDPIHNGDKVTIRWVSRGR